MLNDILVRYGAASAGYARVQRRTVLRHRTAERARVRRPGGRSSTRRIRVQRFALHGANCAIHTSRASSCPEKHVALTKWQRTCQPVEPASALILWELCGTASMQIANIPMWRLRKARQLRDVGHIAWGFCRKRSRNAARSRIASTHLQRVANTSAADKLCCVKTAAENVLANDSCIVAMRRACDWLPAFTTALTRTLLVPYRATSNCNRDMRRGPVLQRASGMKPAIFLGCAIGTCVARWGALATFFLEL